MLYSKCLQTPNRYLLNLYLFMSGQCWHGRKLLLGNEQMCKVVLCLLVYYYPSATTHKTELSLHSCTAGVDYLFPLTDAPLFKVMMMTVGSMLG